MNDEIERKREQLRLHDEARFPARVDRAARTKVHGVIPDGFFAAASSECRDLFIDGHYYGCISLAQAVAEGLTQFLARFHPVGAKNDPPERAKRFHEQGFITKHSLEAFTRVWGNDRNTLHHVNPDIVTSHEELEKRAEECVEALYDIESEIFAFQIHEGSIVAMNPAYWPRPDATHTQAFLRLGGY